jgi:hypothetical protein
MQILYVNWFHSTYNSQNIQVAAQSVEQKQNMGNTMKNLTVDCLL